MEWFFALTPLTKFIYSLVPILTGGVVWLAKIYLAERAKAEAANATATRLMKETEKLKSKYAKELEEIRKDHQLDVTKRKYLYEHKKAEYSKYFQILDDFTTQFRLGSQSSMMDIINKLMSETIAANTQGERDTAMIKFNDHISALFNGITKEFEIVRKESNSIRLGASDKVLAKLNAVDKLYNKSFEFSNDMMKRLLSLMLAGDTDAIYADQTKLMQIAKDTNQAVDDLRETMRADLKEI